MSFPNGAFTTHPAIFSRQLLSMTSMDSLVCCQHTRITLRGLAALVLLVCLVSAVLANDTQYIYGTSIDGFTKQLAVDRTPALYTGNFVTQKPFLVHFTF